MQSDDISGQIIFLNGVPNAGKTTLAIGIQAALEDPYWHLSLDEFAYGFTREHWLGPHRPSFLRIMHGYMRSLRQLALCGNNIVAESIFTPTRLGEYLDLFGDLPVLLVGLQVPLEEAQRRERERTDRIQPYEVTAGDVEAVHAHRIYDLELDTFRLTPEEAVRRVLALVASPPAPTAMQQLIAVHSASNRVGCAVSPDGQLLTERCRSHRSRADG